MTLIGELSQGELAMFLIMLPDDLQGQALLLLLDDGEHLRATLVSKSIKHNLNVSR